MSCSKREDLRLNIQKSDSHKNLKERNQGTEQAGKQSVEIRISEKHKMIFLVQ